MRYLLFLPLMMGTLHQPSGKLKAATANNGTLNHRSDLNKTKTNKFGISIILYRLPKAEKLEDIKDLEIQIAKTADTRVNLYKITGDLATIFLNTTDPFTNSKTIAYRMLYGNRAGKSVSVGDVGGFLATSEIKEITQWIKKNKIETFEGFSKVYDNLSNEVKKELEEMGTEDKAGLFDGYVRPLVVLYFTALENDNSVVFIGR